jgi:hypothetical protein
LARLILPYRRARAANRCAKRFQPSRGPGGRMPFSRQAAAWPERSRRCCGARERRIAH